jgi:hypothetical protein
MLDETTAPIMGVSTAKTSVPGSSTQRDVRSANTPPPTPKTTISLMLNDACPEGWACRGGGTGTSASGDGTCAARWTGLPQFEQYRSSGRSSCPQLLQYLSEYLSGTFAALPYLLSSSYTKSPA